MKHTDFHIGNDPDDFIGPPYWVAEHVFDEYDLGGCWLDGADQW
jgi:hypothetical protein